MTTKTNGEQMDFILKAMREISANSPAEKELLDFILRSEETRFAFMKTASFMAWTFPMIFVDLITVLDAGKQEILRQMRIQEQSGHN